MACRFLALPAELRIKIYEETFADARDPWYESLRRTPAILMACWTTYREACGLYYSSCDCILSSLVGMARQLVLPPSVLRVIFAHIIEDLVLPGRQCLSQLTIEVPPHKKTKLYPKNVLLQLDLELLRAYNRYARGRHRGPHFWHERLRLRKRNESQDYITHFLDKHIKESSRYRTQHKKRSSQYT